MIKSGDRKGPLKALRVLELCNMLAGPFAANLFADWGADVIKVEMPGVGDMFRMLAPLVEEQSIRWLTVARNKRNITVNMNTPEGRDIILKLVEEADIVLENFRPGTIEKWGLGYDEMKAVNPKVVLCRISGYGQTGPNSYKAGFGQALTAFSGYTALQGFPDLPPVSPGLSLADLLAGIFAVMGGLSAVLSIYKGERTEGQVVDVSLYEPLVRLQESTITDYGLTGRVIEREPLSTVAAAPCYIFRSKDQKWVVIIVSSQRTWDRFASAIGHPEWLEDPRFATNPDRVENKQVLFAEIDKWTASLSCTEICAALDEAGVPACPVYEVDDQFKDPHYKARENIVEVDHPVFGKVPMPGITPVFSETPGEIRHYGQEMGAFNEEVLMGDLGMTLSEFERLKSKNII